MNYYVFIDENNGHFREYYNFMSYASEEQITYATNQMRGEYPMYGRIGSTVYNLEKKLKELNFKVIIEANQKNRCAADRVQIPCIYGNY
jgi:hypothetical protein